MQEVNYPATAKKDFKIKHNPQKKPLFKSGFFISHLLIKPIPFLMGFVKQE